MFYRLTVSRVTQLSAGGVERVNAKMLEYLVDVETDVVAFLYREGNMQVRMHQSPGNVLAVP